MAKVILKAVFGDAGLLKKVLDSAAEVIKESNFSFLKGGLQMKAIDESHVAWIGLDIPKSGFDSYECADDFKIRLSMSSLINVMKCSSASDIVHIEYAESMDTITISFTTKKQDRMSKFHVPLLNVETDDDFDVEMETDDCVVTMSSMELARTISNLTKFDNVIRIKCNRRKLEFSCKGIGGTAEISFPSDNMGTSIKTEDSLNMCFNARFLLLFTKASALSEKATLRISDRDFLRLKFDFGTHAKKVGSIRFILAPRVGEEDDLA